jgi:D-methionine transport system ATP-binding protein
MAVIREVCDNVAVLEGGRVVESGAVWQVFGDPQHAATRGLLRPLVHDLPAEWATRLRRLDDGPVPGAPQASVLLDLRFTGGAREADVGALFNALAVHSPKVRLIHGALEPIQGHLQGRLVLSAELPAQLPPERAYRALLEVARGAADQAEALGYV